MYKYLLNALAWMLIGHIFDVVVWHFTCYFVFLAPRRRSSSRTLNLPRDEVTILQQQLQEMREKVC